MHNKFERPIRLKANLRPEVRDEDMGAEETLETAFTDQTETTKPWKKKAKTRMKTIPTTSKHY
jgi:hypothetical protein